MMVLARDWAMLVTPLQTLGGDQDQEHPKSVMRPKPDGAQQGACNSGQGQPCWCVTKISTMFRRH